MPTPTPTRLEGPEGPLGDPREPAAGRGLLLALVMLGAAVWLSGCSIALTATATWPWHPKQPSTHSGVSDAPSPAPSPSPSPSPEGGR